MPLFQILAYAYIANSCEHNSSYSFLSYYDILLQVIPMLFFFKYLLMNILVYLIGGLHFLRV